MPTVWRALLLQRWPSLKHHVDTLASKAGGFVPFYLERAALFAPPPCASTSYAPELSDLLISLEVVQGGTRLAETSFQLRGQGSWTIVDVAAKPVNLRCPSDLRCALVVHDLSNGLSAPLNRHASTMSTRMTVPDVDEISFHAQEPGLRDMHGVTSETSAVFWYDSESLQYFHREGATCDWKPVTLTLMVLLLLDDQEVTSDWCKGDSASRIAVKVLRGRDGHTSIASDEEISRAFGRLLKGRTN